MFCPQCGAQADQSTKFCKTCGAKLTEHALLLAAPREAEPTRISREEALRQLRCLKGSRSLVASTLLTPLLLLFVGAAASAHGPDADVLGIIAFFLTCIWLGTGGWGIVNLLRGDFFKTYKERRVRAEAALLAQPGSRIRENPGLPPETNRFLSQSEAASIIEPTTRELHSAPGAPPGKIN